jgi:hypothetical protein
LPDEPTKEIVAFVLHVKKYYNKQSFVFERSDKFFCKKPLIDLL